MVAFSFVFDRDGNNSKPLRSITGFNTDTNTPELFCETSFIAVTFIANSPLFVNVCVRLVLRDVNAGLPSPKSTKNVGKARFLEFVVGH